jgi:membrane-bound serine protease (ClpP class)
MLPDVSVGLPVVAVALFAGVVLGLLIAGVAARLHQLPSTSSLRRLEGASGTTRGTLNPEGIVHVHGELWSARLRVGQLGPGEPVRVVARHGLVLEVEPMTFRGAATRKGVSR